MINRTNLISHSNDVSESQRCPADPADGRTPQSLSSNNKTSFLDSVILLKIVSNEIRLMTILKAT